MSPENGQGLIYHVILIGLGTLNPASLEAFDNPPGIHVEAEGDASPMLGKVLYGQAEPSWTCRPKRNPVRAGREALIRERLAEQLIIDPEIFTGNTALGKARAPACLEDVDGLSGKALRNPPLNRTAPQPFVLKRIKAGQVGEAPNLFAGVPGKIFGVIEPEGAARFRAEVPIDNLANPGVKLPGRMLNLLSGRF
tara:strand:+ start:757 stop:1341 length:585 start_codon:yes stop_codon:yes gene_type:complete